MPVFRAPVRGIAYSEALARAYASAPEADVLLDTLELRHAAFVDAGQPYAVRVVNDHSPLVAYLEAGAPLNGGEEVTFLPCGFTMDRPKEDDSGRPPELTITISNVARQVAPYLRLARNSRSYLHVTWRQYMPHDLTAPHIDPPMTLVMSDVTTSMNDVQGRATFRQFLGRRFPAREYTLRTFPNLGIK